MNLPTISPLELELYGEPTWEVARLFPGQGQWTEGDYLALRTKQRVELVDGCLEIPPFLTWEHQGVLSDLFGWFYDFNKENDLGRVLVGSFPIRLRHNTMRQPDIVFMKNENFDRRNNEFWYGADLVAEVVSEEDPDRDWIDKVRDYAQAGIPEYWIVDPRDRTVTVLTLPEGASEYAEAGRYGEGETAVSVLLNGFAVNVSNVFSAN